MWERCHFEIGRCTAIEMKEIFLDAIRILSQNRSLCTKTFSEMDHALYSLIGSKDDQTLISGGIVYHFSYCRNVFMVELDRFNQRVVQGKTMLIHCYPNGVDTVRFY